MPSIAQQDYIVIAPKVGNTITVDAYALGQLAKILEKGDTGIFDVILENPEINDLPDVIRSKVLNYFYSEGGKLGDVTISSDSGIVTISVLYTSTQYEGLAAVQEAGEAQYPGEGITYSLPGFEVDAGALVERVLGLSITDLEGHKISVTTTDGKLATVAVSEETDPDGIQVPFEEIQKLVGLPITV